MTGSIRLGLVGCGWAAGEIVRASAMLPTLKIAVAYDADAARAAALAESSGARVAASLEALLADPGIDTVYVGIPHALLAPTVEAALNAGKHVLAEKPLALDVTTARRLGALAEKVANLGELRAALARARNADRSTVVVIDTDPLKTTEAGGWWWDVAVPEVSDRPEVNAARRDYEQRIRMKRDLS